MFNIKAQIIGIEDFPALIFSRKENDQGLKDVEFQFDEIESTQTKWNMLSKFQDESEWSGVSNFHFHFVNNIDGTEVRLFLIIDFPEKQLSKTDNNIVNTLEYEVKVQIVSIDFIQGGSIIKRQDGFGLVYMSLRDQIKDISMINDCYIKLKDKKINFS